MDQRRSFGVKCQDLIAESGGRLRVLSALIVVVMNVVI